MKKILLSIMLCSVFYGTTFATYSRTTSGGGANGYNKTQKVVGNGNTTITCSGSGYDSCPHIFKQSPETDNDPNIDNADILLKFAIEKIQNGELSGSEIQNGLTVNWLSDDTNMSNSEITIH